MGSDPDDAHCPLNRCQQVKVCNLVNKHSEGQIIGLSNEIPVYVFLYSSHTKQRKVSYLIDMTKAQLYLGIVWLVVLEKNEKYLIRPFRFHLDLSSCMSSSGSFRNNVNEKIVLRP